MNLEDKKQFDFIIVDGDSFIHRAYHGYKKSKFVTEHNFAIKGFLEMLRKLMMEYSAYHYAIVFDFQGDSFRNEIYPEYKQNRKPKSDEFMEQIRMIHRLIKYSGIPYFCKKGYEGDDVIGTLVRKGQLKDWEIAIFSGDKDLAQLLNEKTIIIDTNKRTQKKITLNNMNNYFDVSEPKDIIELLAIQGDTADNIPGLISCSHKTTLNLIKRFKTIENLIESNIDDVEEELKKTLKKKDDINNALNQIMNEKESLLLSKRLTSICDHIEMNLTIKDIKIDKDKIKKEAIMQLLNHYQLNLNFSYSDEIVNNIKSV